MEDACCHYAFTFSLLILHLDTIVLSILFSHVLSMVSAFSIRFLTTRNNR